MRGVAALVLVIGLLGCSNNPEWSKDGVSPSRAAQDYADCRSDAQAAISRDVNIQSDIMATRGRDWQASGAMQTKTAGFAAENQDSEQGSVSRCMIGKGYVPGA